MLNAHVHAHALPHAHAAPRTPPQGYVVLERPYAFKQWVEKYLDSIPGGWVPVGGGQIDVCQLWRLGGGREGRA